jgi:hypothetical protein
MDGIHGMCMGEIRYGYKIPIIRGITRETRCRWVDTITTKLREIWCRVEN